MQHSSSTVGRWCAATALWCAVLSAEADANVITVKLTGDFVNGVTKVDVTGVPGGSTFVQI